MRLGKADDVPLFKPPKQEEGMASINPETLERAKEILKRDNYTWSTWVKEFPPQDIGGEVEVWVVGRWKGEPRMKLAGDEEESLKAVILHKDGGYVEEASSSTTS